MPGQNKGKHTIIIRAWSIVCLLLLFGCPPDHGRGSNPIGSGNPVGSTNSAPVANAGWDDSVEAGTVLGLSGTGSYDPDGDALTYTWTITAKPEGSTAALSGAHDLYPTFTADSAGTYVIELVVNDGQIDSAPDLKTVTAYQYSANNYSPVADAGYDQYVLTGDVVNLDGSLSSDFEADALTCTWTFVSKPDNSLASLSTVTGLYPSFTADKEGTYEIRLLVNDGHTDSYPDSVFVTAITLVPSRVPDTGQTTGYTATIGEDADYAINTPSYTGNGNGTVTDNVTGLMWQQQDDGSTMDWNAATAYCGDLVLAGYTDWRLPDNKELIGIVNYGSSNPAIDSTFFPNTKTTSYWSSTAYMTDTTTWLEVVFDDGSNAMTANNHSTRTYPVRCVRGGPEWIVFTDNQDGTVTDDITTLMWEQADDGTARSWEEALTHCEGLSLAGYSDWRLPNLKELHSIVEYNVFPAIDTTLFPNASADRHWSSTTRDSFPGIAWNVNFVTGTVDFINKTHTNYSRCVRGGY